MNQESVIKDKERFEIQRKSQDLINKELGQAHSFLAEKLSQEERLQAAFELELQRVKTEYSQFLAVSQNRESDLLSQLKEKDEKITSNKQKLENFKISNEKLQSLNLNLAKETNTFEPCPMILASTLNDPGVFDSSNLEQLKTQLNTLSDAWKNTGTDEWEEQTLKIEELRSALTTLQQQHKTCLETWTGLQTDSEHLQVTLNDLKKSSSSFLTEKEKLRICEEELQELKAVTQESQEKQESLLEKLKIFRVEKETLQNKLEKVYEMLVKENLVTSEHQEMLAGEVETLKKLTEQLESEKAENEEISEQVIQEKMNAARIKEQLAKVKDIDVVLGQTLKQIDMEGAVRKTETGYFYKDCQINLYLHSETMVVVKIGAGLMPLADYLKNSQMPGKVLMPKNVLGESKQDNLSKRELKSPLKGAPVSAIKSNKTPLRQKTVGSKN